MTAEQPPTREQIVALDRLRADLAHGQEFGNRNIVIRVADLDAVLALLPQPTPSAEPVKRMLLTHPHDGHGPNDTCRDCDAAPPSIADMAPGTTFTADTWPGAFPARWRKEPDGWVSRIANGGRSFYPEPPIDPSTIRDVTPPKGVQ